MGDLVDGWVVALFLATDCVSVCLLNMVSEIVTAAHNDL